MEKNADTKYVRRYCFKNEDTNKSQSTMQVSIRVLVKCTFIFIHFAP